jgi:hypothetical protein
MSDWRSVVVSVLLAIVVLGAAIVGLLICAEQEPDIRREVMWLVIESNQAARAEARGDFE